MLFKQDSMIGFNWVQKPISMGGSKSQGWSTSRVLFSQALHQQIQDNKLKDVTRAPVSISCPNEENSSELCYLF